MLRRSRCVQNFLRRGAYFVLIFELLGGFDPRMAQTKALAGAITKMRCSVVAKMFFKSSTTHVGSIVATSRVVCDMKIAV